MNAKVNRIVGIDLGTTYSAIAYVTDDGRAEIIRDLQDARTTPSVVFFDEGGGAKVGSIAREEALGFPDRVVALAKRVMGTDATFAIDGEAYAPQTISGFVLKKLKEDAERALGHEVTDAVVTVPAYFGLAQRKATEDAAALAGLNARHILSEPTAAAIAFGMEQGKSSRAGATRTLLVYDLGGGTFDITLLHLTPAAGMPTIDVISTDGDSSLGGADWDRAMVEHVLKAFREEHGIDPSLDLALLQGLAQKCEKAKFALATAATSTVTCTHAGKTVKVSFDRDRLKQLTGSLLERTLDMVDSLLEAKEIAHDAIDEVLLVGGSTKLLMVREALAERFGADRVNTSLHPDLCVAQGAAWYGHLLGRAVEEASNGGGGRSDGMAFGEPAEDGMVFGIIDVCPFALGTAALTGSGKPDDRHEMVFALIPKDSRLPCEESGRFYTVKANQPSVLFKIYDNTSRAKLEQTPPELSRLIANVRLTGLPPDRPAGQPLDVTFKLDAGFRLQVIGVDVNSGRRVEADIQYKCDMPCEALMRAGDLVRHTAVES